MKFLSIPALFLLGSALSSTSAAFSGVITTYCDGSTIVCPCANNGAAGNGCFNSVPLNTGANLSATGRADVSADTIVLTASFMPASTGVLFIQGSATASVLFGDGRRCVGGSIMRIGIKTAVLGTASYPSAATDLPVSVLGQVPLLGGTRYYQAWYRDSVGFCTPANYNLTNGLDIAWVP